jgi:hypothetical protein
MFRFAVVLTLVALVLAVPVPARAHCDTLNGPVVAAARIALQRGDVTPVLKWVEPESEAEVRSAFVRTLAVRKTGPEARDLADLYFFETLVRLHRAGEGAPYTGLKPADTKLEPSVEAADQALDRGSAEAVIKLVTAHVAEGIRERYGRAAEAKRHADEGVAQGRAFVAAYVEFLHYVENLDLASAASHAHHAEAEEAPAHTPTRK